MVAFLDQLRQPAPTGDTPLASDHCSILDLGCGNGSLLFALRRDSWSGPALGVDYSPQSLTLARSIAASRPDLASCPAVDFAQWDVVSGPLDVVISRLGPGSHGWDLVLDKGTFDAVSLSAETDNHERRPCEGYRDRVLQLLRPGGFFLLTSCNWTEEELVSWFIAPQPLDGHAFRLVATVPYRAFRFGGAVGQAVTTICCQKT